MEAHKRWEPFASEAEVSLFAGGAAFCQVCAWLSPALFALCHLHSWPATLVPSPSQASAFVIPEVTC